MTSETTGITSDTETYAGEVRSGVIAVSPLLFAVAPFASAMAVAAHSAGFSPIETLLMSVFVFAGAAQMAAISLVASGAGLLTIALTTLLLNLRHVMYGLSLDRHLPATTTPSRGILAFLLVDESYGIAVARAPSRHRIDAYFLGASLGMYVTFVLFTGIGALFAAIIPEVDKLGLEFIFPLAFIALLIPLLNRLNRIANAVVSGTLAIMLLQVLDPGLAILIAIISGAATEAVWKER